MIIFATILTISMYILFSTFFHNLDIVGTLGKNIGSLNIEFFGYLSYIFPTIFLIPIHKVYKNKRVDKIDVYVGWSLFFISLLILQALIAREYSGIISTITYKSLVPFIGYAGLWLLFLFILILSISIIKQTGIEELKDFISNNIVSRYFNYLLDYIFELSRQKTAKKKKRKTAQSKTSKSIKKNSESAKNAHKIDDVKLRNTLKKSGDENIIDVEIEKENKQNLKDKTLFVNEIDKKKRLPKKIEIDKNLKDNFQKKDNNEIKLNQKNDKKKSIQKETKKNKFKLPPVELLQNPPQNTKRIDTKKLEIKKSELINKLKEFKVEGEVVNIFTGPLVTIFEFKPAPNIKVSKILRLQNDLAMALSAKTIRIQAPIPGRNVVGIEIPNSEFETIYLREILESKEFKESKSSLTIALGKDIIGSPFITDLKKLPHLLIAGTTGSGKSVGINAMIISLLYKNRPDELKFILIDPKMLEFSIYNDIPHLLTPVVVEPSRAVVVLNNLLKEMESRYRAMAKEKVKNIDSFNRKQVKKGAKKMPYIVVIIDELADLMMTGGKKVEFSISRLAQMARAAGIHMVIATQRPTANIVTGLIKANLPARLSYKVGQKIDSKVILDKMGADLLLGRGDALFNPPDNSGLIRVHAPWCSEEEIEKVVEFLNAQQSPNYDESLLKEEEKKGSKKTDK